MHSATDWSHNSKCLYVTGLDKNGKNWAATKYVTVVCASSTHELPPWQDLSLVTFSLPLACMPSPNYS